MKISIHLPVPAYILKYLEFKYGQNYQAKESDWFGLLLISNMEKKRSLYYDSKKQEGDHMFLVTVGIKKAEMVGYTFHRMRQKQLVKAVDRHFREELFMHAIFNFLNHQIPFKNSLQNMLQSYQISENDLQYDSIRKDFNRNKYRMMQKLKKI